MLLAGIVLIGGESVAEDEDVPWEGLDQMHQQASAAVVEIGRRLDGLFGGRDYPPVTEGSLLRLGGSLLLSENGASFDPQLRARLALPHTERRWNLFLESTLDDPFDPRHTEGRRPGEEDTGLLAGLQYLLTFGEFWDLDADLGLRVRWPLDPYARVRLSRSWLSQPWELRLRQSLFWYEQIGEGVSSELRLQRELGSWRLARLEGDVTWLERDQAFYYSQDLLLSQRLRHRHGVVYQFGVRGQSEPNHRVEAYFLNLRARRSVGREWLFVELRPELYFGRENEFSLERRLFLTLEVVLGDLQGLD